MDGPITRKENYWISFFFSLAIVGAMTLLISVATLTRDGLWYIALSMVVAVAATTFIIGKWSEYEP